MRRPAFTRIPILAVTVLALVLAPISAATAAPAAVHDHGRSSSALHYRLVDLGTLGGESSYATAVNDRGWVVGMAQTATGTYHGFVWRRGAMTDLGLFTPTDINNWGQVVGTRTDSDRVHLWSRGHMRALGRRFTFPVAINDRGQVVGHQTVADRPPVPARWSKGTIRTLPLDDVSGINDRGLISGGRTLGTEGFHAGVWRRGRVTDLGAAAFNRSNSYGINNRGWVIGWVFSAQQDERGALWRHGTRTDLGTLGGDHTHAVAINDRGVILVTSQLASRLEHPALWRHGRLIDLSPAGVHDDVSDLNDRGEIVGSIRPVFGISHAVIYRPVPAVEH